VVEVETPTALEARQLKTAQPNACLFIPVADTRAADSEAAIWRKLLNEMSSEVGGRSGDPAEGRRGGTTSNGKGVCEVEGAVSRQDANVFGTINAHSCSFLALMSQANMKLNSTCTSRVKILGRFAPNSSRQGERDVADKV
jgi:hypothetical protein